jgi:hypothetical protein
MINKKATGIPFVQTRVESLSDKVRKCSSCGGDAQYFATAQFRVGGTSGGWKLVFGEWAELGEQMIPMHIYVCSVCGKIELIATEDLRNQLRQMKK